MIKSEIRKIIKEAKQQLTLDERIEYSNIISSSIIKQDYFKNAKAIYIYVSYNEEVFTKPLIEYILSQQIQVAVPKIIDGKMNFYYIESLKELKEGAYGILEPSVNHLAEDKFVLMIMPGLAFDIIGNRIGYGGGYYDKYLEEKQYLNFRKVAVSYDFQIFDFLETKEYDKKVDNIITEKRIINIK